MNNKVFDITDKRCNHEVRITPLFVRNKCTSSLLGFSENLGNPEIGLIFPLFSLKWKF